MDQSNQSQKLNQLIYAFSARHGLKLKDFSSILEFATRKNARADVTGALIYHSANFMQLLEGDNRTHKWNFQKDLFRRTSS